MLTMLFNALAALTPTVAGSPKYLLGANDPIVLIANLNGAR